MTLRRSGLACLLLLSACVATGQPSGDRVDAPACSDQDLQSWRFSAIQAIARQRHYPPEALAADHQGEVKVQISVDPRGRLLEARIAQSSGFATLDAAALEQVRLASFPPAPECGGRTVPLSFSIPLHFRIHEDRPAPITLTEDWAGRIRAKVRSRLSIPQGTPADVEVSFSVVQLPTGEILSVKMLSSSGFRAYDDATELAIWRSSPLPRPDAPALFRRELLLKFRP